MSRGLDDAVSALAENQSKEPRWIISDNNDSTIDFFNFFNIYMKIFKRSFKYVVLMMKEFSNYVVPLS